MNSADITCGLRLGSTVLNELLRRKVAGGQGAGAGRGWVGRSLLHESFDRPAFQSGLDSLNGLNTYA